MKSLLREYRTFVFRGNLLDLATAFVLGVAFNAVVQAFTNGIVLALVAAVFGEPSFNNVTIGLGDGQILVGVFLTAVVNFLIIAAVMFLLLRAASRMRRHKEEPVEEAPAPSDEALLLTEIRDLLRARRG